MDKLCPYRKSAQILFADGNDVPTGSEESFLPCIGEACMMYVKAHPAQFINEEGVTSEGRIPAHCALAVKP